ncbi:nitrite reductase (NAD(P)H) small subunit, partial [Escherichia coli]|uniref:nitrite reductase (NAD(P)H) small subunit n=1 Tax=Escherichia coli TaxID=562 RepID=UPI002283BA10
MRSNVVIALRQEAPFNVRPDAWQPVCTRRDLVADSGVVALVDGRQVALFYLPAVAGETLYAIDNRDPKS